MEELRVTFEQPLRSSGEVLVGPYAVDLVGQRVEAVAAV